MELCGWHSTLFKMVLMSYFSISCTCMFLCVACHLLADIELNPLKNKLCLIGRPLYKLPKLSL